MSALSCTDSGDYSPMRNRFAKILATLGPASRAPDTLRLLHDVGVDAFRLNFSHGSHEDHAASVKAIRKVQDETGNPICIALRFTIRRASD